LLRLARLDRLLRLRRLRRLACRLLLDRFGCWLLRWLHRFHRLLRFPG
jgi:hypothetical protein